MVKSKAWLLGLDVGSQLVAYAVHLHLGILYRYAVQCGDHHVYLIAKRTSLLNLHSALQGQYLALKEAASGSADRIQRLTQATEGTDKEIAQLKFDLAAMTGLVRMHHHCKCGLQ